MDALAQMHLKAANDHLQSLRRAAAEERLAAAARVPSTRPARRGFVRRSLGFSLVRALRIGGTA